MVTESESILAASDRYSLLCSLEMRCYGGGDFGYYGEVVFVLSRHTCVTIITGLHK
jgi:hypothetical protein